MSDPKPTTLPAVDPHMRALPPSVQNNLVELMRRVWLTRKEFSSTPRADDPMWQDLEVWWRGEKGLTGPAAKPS